jgi:hypothetical protein
MKTLRFPAWIIPLAGLFSAHAEQPAEPPPVVLETRIIPLEGRRAIIEKVSRIDVPDPPEPPAPRPAGADVAPPDAEWLAGYQAMRERHPMVVAGATVYRLSDGRSITHVTGWRVNNGPPVDFWSSADFSLLAHPGGFATPDEVHYSFLLMWTPCDVAFWAEVLALHGLEFTPPEIPAFADGPATFHAVPAPGGTPPDEAALAAIGDFHDHYNAHRAELQAAFDLREAENEARRAELLANPPVPRDIRLKVSRLTPGQAAAWHRHHTLHRNDGTADAR